MHMDAAEIMNLMVTKQLPHSSSTILHLWNRSGKCFMHLDEPVKLQWKKQGSLYYNAANLGLKNNAKKCT
jgi:hypothetical protein